MDLAAMAASMGLSSVNIGGAVKDDAQRRLSRKPSDHSDTSTTSAVNVTLDVSALDGVYGSVRVTLDISALEDTPPAM